MSCVLFARERALEFYKRHGYELKEKAHLAYDDVQHWKMGEAKTICTRLVSATLTGRKYCKNTWRRIYSDQRCDWALKLNSYTDWQFTTSADLNANLNLHNTMFCRFYL